MLKRLSTLMLMMAFTIAVMAQVTTSSMSGQVTIKGSNEPIVGATVQVVHDPSGTQYGAVTNVDGRFNIQGMRVGRLLKKYLTVTIYKCIP